MKYVASVSWGKDSLAMLLMLIEKKWQLDSVVFFDTGKEFQAIYNTRDKMLPILQDHGIEYVEFHPDESFDYIMYEKRKITKKTNEVKFGYSWCGGPNRWGTNKKQKKIKEYCKDAIQYIGLAYDEPLRIKRNRNQNNIMFPLNEWKMTEDDCLQYCYDHGFTWLEGDIRLYDILSRVSCWCCKNKNLEELENMYKYLPQYWQQLKNIQSRLDEPMKNGLTVFDLENRFKDANK